jgi:6-phosphogluconolactonase
MFAPKMSSTLPASLTASLLLLSLAGALGCATTRPAAGPAFDPGDRVPFVYVGGYRPEISIFRLDMKTGQLTPAGSVTAGEAPSFLAWDPAGKTLFAADEIDNGRVLAFAIDGKTGGLHPLNQVSSAGVGPAHLSVDRSGRWVLVANYADEKSGTIAVLPVGPDGTVGPAVDTKDYGPATMPHAILTDPANQNVYVPCKGGPYVVQLGFDPATGKLTPHLPDRIASPPASGPRHMAFHPNMDVAYVINEKTMNVNVYAHDRSSGRLAEQQLVDTLPPGSDARAPGLSTAEIEVHPNGKFVYGSNRGHNSIVIYRVGERGNLALVGHEARNIKKPRHFQIDPTGKLLLVANQDGDSVSVFSIDRDTGLLSPLGGPQPAGKQPSFVGTLFLPGH